MGGAGIANGEATRARIIAWFLAAVVVACAIGDTVVVVTATPNMFGWGALGGVLQAHGAGADIALEVRLPVDAGPGT